MTLLRNCTAASSLVTCQVWREAQGSNVHWGKELSSEAGKHGKSNERKPQASPGPPAAKRDGEGLPKKKPTARTRQGPNPDLLRRKVSGEWAQQRLSGSLAINGVQQRLSGSLACPPINTRATKMAHWPDSSKDPIGNPKHPMRCSAILGDRPVSESTQSGAVEPHYS